MVKTARQINVEKNNPGMGQPIKLRVIKPSKNSPAKVGEVVNAVRWGTFGCWDDNNRWIDFYCCEIVK